MMNNADVDFNIFEDDVKTLKNLDKIKDYGDAGTMSVFAGKLNLKAILAMMFPKKRS